MKHLMLVVLVSCGAPGMSGLGNGEVKDEVSAAETEQIDSASFLLEEVIPDLCNGYRLTGTIKGVAVQFAVSCDFGLVSYGASAEEAQANTRILDGKELQGLIQAVERAQGVEYLRGALWALAKASPSPITGSMGLSRTKFGFTLNRHDHSRGTAYRWVSGSGENTKTIQTGYYFDYEAKLLHLDDKPMALYDIEEVRALPVVRGADLSDFLGSLGMWDDDGVRFIARNVDRSSLPTEADQRAFEEEFTAQLVALGLGSSLLVNTRINVGMPAFGLEIDSNDASAVEKVSALLSRDANGFRTYNGTYIAWVHLGLFPAD